MASIYVSPEKVRPSFFVVTGSSGSRWRESQGSRRSRRRSSWWQSTPPWSWSWMWGCGRGRWWGSHRHHSNNPAQHIYSQTTISVCRAPLMIDPSTDDQSDRCCGWRRCSSRTEACPSWPPQRCPPPGRCSPGPVGTWQTPQSWADVVSWGRDEVHEAQSTCLRPPAPVSPPGIGSGSGGRHHWGSPCLCWCQVLQD